MEEFEIYKGKTFADLCKDIVKNSTSTRNQVDVIIHDLKKMVNGIDEAVVVYPMMKDYIDVGVRNDEALIKLGAIIQRVAANHKKAGGNDFIEGDFIVSADERKAMADAAEASVALSLPDREKAIEEAKNKLENF